MLDGLLYGVATLVRAGYHPTGGMYLLHGAFCVLGLITWWRAERASHQPAAPLPVDEGVPA